MMRLWEVYALGRKRSTVASEGVRWAMVTADSRGKGVAATGRVTPDSCRGLWRFHSRKAGDLNGVGAG
jgi:hypothetical protein